MSPEQHQEGPRLRHFRQTLQKMLQASMKQCTSSDKIDQTFQFKLAPAQLSRLEQCLATEFESTSEKIKANFEKTLELHELPPKLNTVDEALKALHPDHKAEPRSDIDPEALIKAQLAPAKLEMINRLKASIAQLEKENEQATAEVNQRQIVVENRISNVKSARSKYVEAFNHSSDISVGDMETLIDRMAHQQTVPIKPLSS